ncbi:MAG: DUF6516 family protein, partial [Melioribacteraceae bacterium]|nr:DUF6516 family protein [Melioribacteraceae bacterium]
KFQVHDFKEFQNGFYIKVVAQLTNNTSLFIREYSDEFERNYSYHLQDVNSKLIVRWDNAPNHKNLSTYPFHKHTGQVVESTNEISLSDVLTNIEKQISN